jgi:hypothetical protein
MSNLLTTHEQYLQSVIVDQCERISGLEAEVADNYSSAADRIAELMAECAELKNPWQPIETAPMDGTLILLFQSDSYNQSPEPITASWDNSFGWMDNARGSWWGFDATHWMPLPKPPTISTKESQP